MKAVGIICEYNPLHKGHEYHIKTARRDLGADAVIGVMSGNFVQRGDFACFDKWTRARWAIDSGMDLVLELPAPFSCASAEFFAKAGVDILNACGVVDFLSFGSESGTLEGLTNCANALSSEEFKAELSKCSAQYFGRSFPYIRQKALSAIIGDDASLIEKPNNILAVEYIKAIVSTKSAIIPTTVKRQGADYNSSDTSEFMSATGIRGLMDLGRYKEAADNLPDTLKEDFLRTVSSYGGHIKGISSFGSTVLYRLKSMSISDFEALPDTGEGLSNRLFEAAAKAFTLDEFIKAVSTKRYTQSRIDRIILSALLGITRAEIEGGVSCIRVLGFNDTGRALLAKMRKKATLPIITKPAYCKHKGLSEYIKREQFRTSVYCLASPNLRLNEITQTPYYFKNE